MERKFITEFAIKYEEIYLRKETNHNYFYKITNLINDKFYYGIHSTNNLDDGYMGSGRKIIKAIEKYGIENFTKEILADYSTRKEASDHEKLIVTREMVNLDECYNMVLGGIDKDCSGENNPYYGKNHTEESKEIIREKRKFQVITKETREKVSKTMTGEGNHFYGKHHSEETKEKIRNNRPNAKPCIIDGELFSSIKYASRCLDIKSHIIKNRLNSEKDEWITWQFRINDL